VLDYKYAYAVTHRWSSGSDEEGGVSFNTQNIERSSRLNEVWLAKSGRVCIIGDLAQVECRIIAFLAGEEKLLQLFRDPKIDVYCNFGQSVFGRLITKHDKMERLVAKEAVLGLGFLMGAARFAERLAARAPEAVEFLKKHRQTSDAEEAVRPIVEKYRQSFPLIRKFGLSVRDAYLRVTADDWPTDMPYCVEQRPGAGISVTKCSDRKTLAVKLPTWGTVYYREVARSARESKFRPGELEPVLHYVGGEISFSMPVENIVQATARDVMAHMLLRMESEGIRVVMHTHDELVAEVDMNKAKESLVRVRTIMSEPPPALIGLPLRTEPRLCDRYTKDEERSKAFETKLLGVSSPNRSSFVPVAGTADTTGLSRIVPMETPPKVVFL
jgi:DNA polymerase